LLLFIKPFFWLFVQIIKEICFSSRADLYACSYFVLSAAQPIPWFISAQSSRRIHGLYFPLFNDQGFTGFAQAVKTMAVSFLSMSIYLGQWISGYTSVWIANAVGGTVRQLFSAVGIIFVAFAVIAAVYITLTQKNERKIIIDLDPAA
jgi:hypothetical protein